MSYWKFGKSWKGTPKKVFAFGNSKWYQTQNTICSLKNAEIVIIFSIALGKILDEFSQELKKKIVTDLS